ncbi:MAG TPA: hypothetical protein VNJ07_01965 [Chitinophagales bacterium]|nr:hypothetical protein [Chitinophagales bacterium]
MKTVLFLIAAGIVLTAEAQSPKSREHYHGEIKYYTEKIQEEPDNAAHYYARGIFHHILTNFSASNNDFKKVIELYERNPQKKYARVATDACYFLADDYYFRRADRVNAQAYIDEGLKISPGDKRFEVLQTGIIGSYPEKAEEARKKFESLIAKYPGDEKLLLYYARFLERTDPKKSAALNEKVIAINPNNIDALFALGSYYANEATRIYKANGDAGKVFDYMKKSVSYFETIHKLNPDDKEIIEILIQCYNHLNLPSEKKKMEKALAEIK